MQMNNKIQRDIDNLEKRVDTLRIHLTRAPRAFVMEFAGTPKSGKSTSVEAIRHFFVRNKLRVHILTERAALCPIPMKGHLFFNTWCAASMLAELLANVETETDIIIVDRGLFDALVWMTMQERRGELTHKEARIIEKFLLLDRWRSLIDLAVVMSVSPKEAIDRETKQRITPKLGSIMNPGVLDSINKAVQEAIDRYKPKFKAIIDHQTTGKEIRQSNIELANKVLDNLELFLNPEILVLPKKRIEELCKSKNNSFGEGAIQSAYKCITDHGQYIKRDDVERDENFVQIIPSALLTYDDEVFLFQRKETDPKYRLYGKSTIWQGCHVSKVIGTDFKQILRNTLQERVSRSLFLSRVFPIEEYGYCWDRNIPSSNQHFGIIFKISIDNKQTAIDLRKKEFRKKRGHGLIGQFADFKEIYRRVDELGLETWSRSIIKYIVGDSDE